MKQYLMGNTELGDTANVGKDLILRQLFDDKVITEKQFNEYAGRYFVVLKRPLIISLFKEVLNKFFGKTDEDLNAHYFVLSKVEKTCKTNY